MAFESGSQGSGLLGRIFTAIGSSKKPDIRHIALSNEGDAAYSNLFKDYNSLLGAQTSGLSDFASQYKSLTPQLAALDQLHASTYGDLLKRAASYDPTANLQTSGNYLFGNLDKYLKTGLNAGTSAMNQSLAAAGYGDRGPGGYSALLNANRITGNLLPAFNNVVSNLTPLSMSQNTDYFRNLAQLPGWMQAQNASLEATPFRNLVPAGVQQDLLRGNIGTVNDLVKNQLANWAFYQKPNAWTTAGNVASGVYGGLFDAMDVANKAASTYGNLMGSGLGGMGGGMGGAEAPSSYPPSTGLGVSQWPGQGTGEGYPLGVTQISPQIGGQYGPLGIGGYSQYNPSSALGGSTYQLPPPTYMPPAYYGGYGSQNPYSQYGGFFS
jgi:hypothetical protein